MFDYELKELDKYYRVDKSTTFNGMISRRIGSGAKQVFADEREVLISNKQYVTSPQFNVFKKARIKKTLQAEKL